LAGVFDDGYTGGKVAGLRVYPVKRAGEATRKKRATVAVLASEETATPEVIQELAGAGISAVLNLTSTRLAASANVMIEQGDLGSLLFRLLCRLPLEEGRAKPRA
jgi:NADH/NAD ratio-sensing transcriptional regulator Rex